MTREISTTIQSHTHELNELSFKIFDQPGMNLRVRDIRKNQFVFIITDHMDQNLTDDEFSTKAHGIFNLYLIAINICTLGLFLPQEDRYLSPSYQFHDTITGRKDNGIAIHDIHRTDFSGQTLTERQIIDSVYMFGALAREKEDELISEYLKGIIHLGSNYPGAHFEKDAFANFYRAFEHFITNRVFGQKKLSNELKQIRIHLKGLGLSEDSLSEFNELYKLRSSQAMHAQLTPEALKRESAMKMKVFTDTVIYRIYQSP